MAAHGMNSRRRHEQSTAYYDFFAGFRFDSATGFFATLDENLPVCGGFGSPRILMLLFAIDYLLSHIHHTPEISSPSLRTLELAASRRRPTPRTRWRPLANGREEG